MIRLPRCRTVTYLAIALFAALMSTQSMAGVRAAGTIRHTSTHGNLQACSVLTLHDVSTVFGKGVRTTRHTSMGAFNTCDYSTKHGFLDFLITTTSLIKSRDSRTRDAATMYALIRSTVPGKATSVAKLGDRAFWASGLGQLWVLKGDVVFNVAQFSQAKQTFALLKAAAQRALRRL
jgi:hypothetical protein